MREIKPFILVQKGADSERIRVVASVWVQVKTETDECVYCFARLNSRDSANSSIALATSARIGIY